MQRKQHRQRPPSLQLDQPLDLIPERPHSASIPDRITVVRASRRSNIGALSPRLAAAVAAQNATADQLDGASSLVHDADLPVRAASPALNWYHDIDGASPHSPQRRRAPSTPRGTSSSSSSTAKR